MAATESERPTYLGLLNAVSIAESRAHYYLTEWAAVTTDPDVRTLLLTVAAREGEHGMSFAKRVNELGYELEDRPDDSVQRALETVRSDLSDLEKIEALGLHEFDSSVFDGVFKDHTIDIQTGELLGRYITEERDTLRLFRACYLQLCEARNDSEQRKSDTKADRAAKATAKQLNALDAKVDALCRSVDELRQIVCAQTMPSGSPG